MTPPGCMRLSQRQGNPTINRGDVNKLRTDRKGIHQDGAVYQQFKPIRHRSLAERRLAQGLSLETLTNSPQATIKAKPPLPYIQLVRQLTSWSYCPTDGASEADPENYDRKGDTIEIGSYDHTNHKWIPSNLPADMVFIIPKDSIIEVLIKNPGGASIKSHMPSLVSTQGSASQSQLSQLVPKDPAMVLELSDNEDADDGIVECAKPEKGDHGKELEKGKSQNEEEVKDEPQEKEALLELTLDVKILTATNLIFKLKERLTDTVDAVVQLGLFKDLRLISQDTGVYELLLQRLCNKTSSPTDKLPLRISSSGIGLGKCGIRRCQQIVRSLGPRKLIPEPDPGSHMTARDNRLLTSSPLGLSPESPQKKERGTNTRRNTRKKVTIQAHSQINHEH
ncbi:hypothetical protein BDV93DRAFT_515955 [Ceratobasidium sp. AG-I]|nr:hypothetical protein BDV93DRAFT_515955 [Ceratobasidium sp. AG-I]